MHFDKIAAVLNQFDLKFVNCINSIGNGLYIDEVTDTVVIKPKGGFGGIGGEYVKPTALANVRALKQRLNPSIEIIGTGGILTGRDAYEHLLCGASMLQVGTQLEKEGLVTRRRSHEDERVVLVQLSEKGEALREKAKKVPCQMAALLTKKGAFLPEEEMEKLKGVLYEIIQRLH